MEHIDLINRIIEAEQHARQMAEETREKRKGMHTELESKTAGLRDSYLERARSRIDKIKEREALLTKEHLAELGAAFENDMKSIETAFKENQDEWVDKLFNMIVRR